MALIHPRSLQRWEEWRRTRRRAQAARDAVVRRARPASRRGGSMSSEHLVLHSRHGDGAARLLLGMDVGSAASQRELLALLPYVNGTVHVLAPVGLDLPELSGPGWQHETAPYPRTMLRELDITSVISLGWGQEVGHLVHDWALGAEVPGAVVQHAPLTPYAPPLPPRTTMLAWSGADAEFQRSGRDDVEVRVVGSQRLWQAAHDAGEPAIDEDARPVFLGQLSAIELPRRMTLGSAMTFGRATGASYRPHPEETDRLSRAEHVLLRRRGLEFQDPSVPLHELGRPVVSVTSPDVLEAAVRGIPAWVFGPRAPGWVHEYWERYGMSRAGTPPTPAPPVAADEPARLIAQIVEGVA